MFMHKLIRVSTDRQICTLGPTRPRCRVGRRKTFNDYPIAHQQVSRTHCIFTFDPDQQATFLTTLEASFGTFLNGIRVENNSCIRLNSGDLIGLGDAVDENVQIRFFIDEDVELVYANIPNPGQEAEVRCKEEVKKEEDESNENEPPNELRVRSVETLTDENSSSRLVDLLSTVPEEEVIVKPDIQYANLYTANQYADPSIEMQYADPSTEGQESSDNHVGYSTVDFVDVEEDNLEEEGESFEESDIKFKLQLQKQDVLAQYYQRLQLGQEQVVDVITLSSDDDEDDCDDDNEISIVWRRLKPDQDKLVKFEVIKTEFDDESEVEEVENVNAHQVSVEDPIDQETSHQEQNEEEQILNIHDATTSDESSSISSAKGKKKLFRERSRSAGRRRRLPSSSGDESPEDKSRRSKPKGLRRSRLENFRNNVLSNEQKSPELVEVSDNRRKTRSMSRGTETKFLKLPDDYEEKTRRSRSKSNLKYRSKSREKQNRSRSKQRSSRSKSRRKSHRKSSPKATRETFETRRRTRSMTRNEETEFVSLPQNHTDSRRRSASRSKLKVLGSEEKDSSKIESKKHREGKPVSVASTSKDFQKRSSRNDQKAGTSYEADSKRHHSSIERRTRSTSQSSTRSERPTSKSRKPSESKISSHVSEKPRKKRTRSQSKREEEESQRKKAKSASKDETATSSTSAEELLARLFGDDDALPGTSTEVPAVQEPLDIREEISSIESEVVSPSSNSHQLGIDLEATKITPAASKRIQVIDALPLITKKRRRSSVYDEPRRTDDEETEPDERAGPSRKVEEPTKTPKKLSEKEKAEVKSRQKEYKTEEKRRHQKYPWAIIPGRKTSGPTCSLSNTEKKEISNTRKETLKQKAIEKQNQETRQKTTPRVKMTEKSRGEKLCDDMNKPVTPQQTANNNETRSSNQETTSDNNKENDEPTEVRNQSDQPPLMQNFLRSILKKRTEERPNEERPRPKKIAFSLNRSVQYIPSNRLLRQEEKKRLREEEQSDTEDSSDCVDNQMIEPITTQDEDGPSSPIVPEQTQPESISPTKSLTKSPTKPLTKSPTKYRSHHRSKSPTILETVRQPVVKESRLHLIWQILQWCPKWLDDQKKLGFQPPLTNYDSMVQLPDSYENFNEYVQKMKPVVMLEMWNRINKFHDTNPSKKSAQKYFISKSQNDDGTAKLYVEKEIPDQKNKVYVTMELKTLVSQSGYVHETHPQKDSLAIIRYKPADRSQIMILFCYVTEVKRTVIRQPTDYDEHLKQICAEPYALVTLSVMMKKSSMPISDDEHDVLISRIGQIRPFIKIWESVHSLIAHPVLSTVLDPAKNPYRFASQNFKSHHKTLSNIINMVYEKNLDEDQKHAVLEAKKIFLQKKSRILAINGLPGTGKSQVVVRIAAELFADGFKKGDSKIIVCAATDSAVDELATRLMALNSKLSINDKFRLIRVGETSDKSRGDLKKLQLRTCAEQVSEQGKYNGVIRELKKKIDYLEKFLKNLDPKNEKSQYKQMRDKLDSCRAQRIAMTSDSVSGPNNTTKDILVDDHFESVIKKKFLMKADIILCTIELCTSEEMESVLSNCKEQVICIIDNACRCIEPQTLTPLLLGVRSLILVGNAEQNAIAHSWNARFLGLKRSLFTRIVQLSPESVITLKTQYRTTMAAIRPFNEYYCDGKFEFSKAPNITISLRPYLILDHNGIEGTDQNEAFFVRKLIHAIWSTMDRTKPLTIGVIAHKDDLAVAIQREIFENIQTFQDTLLVTVETYEKYENQERDVIIVTSALKFLLYDLYIALTRAKHCLYLCANFNNPILKCVFSMQALLEDAKISGTYKKLDVRLNPLDIKTQITHY